MIIAIETTTTIPLTLTRATTMTAIIMIRRRRMIVYLVHRAAPPLEQRVREHGPA